MENETDIFTVTQTAHALGIARHGTLWAIASEGILLVPVEEVARYRDENKGKAGRKPVNAALMPPTTHPMREARVRSLVEVLGETRMPEPVGKFTDVVKDD